jgi:hypothetical protein
MKEKSAIAPIPLVAHSSARKKGHEFGWKGSPYAAIPSEQITRPPWPTDPVPGRQPDQDASTTIVSGVEVAHGPCPGLKDRPPLPWVGSGQADKMTAGLR